MKERHRDLHAIMAALGHASRFRLTLCLLEGERCVGELARAIGLSQSCTTRHVQALERAGVVRSRRDGKRVLVGIEPDRDGLPELLAWLDPGAEAPRRAAPVRADSAGRRSRPTSSRPTSSRAASSRPARRPAGVRGVRPDAASAAGRDEPTGRDADPSPMSGPASGTHAAPEQERRPHPRRASETLEDFLL